MASRIAAGRDTSSSHCCGRPHVAIVFLCPLPSSPRCRCLPISVVVFLILARTTSFLWPLIHRPPVVTADQCWQACRRHRHAVSASMRGLSVADWDGWLQNGSSDGRCEYMYLLELHSWVTAAKADSI